MDDMALRPTSVPLQYDTPEEFDSLATQSDKQTSEAYFHPAWAKVEEMFIEAVEQSRLPVDIKLPADEYKIESVANQKYASKLIEMLARVKDAVTAVESGKQGDN